MLQAAFAWYPSLIAAKVMKDPMTSVSKGFGFANFRDAAEAERALTEMNGIYVGSRAIRTGRAKKAAAASGVDATTAAYAYAQQYAQGYVQMAAPAVPQMQDYATVWQQAPVENTSIYVGNIQIGTPEVMIRQYFVSFGDIANLKSYLDKGHCFIRYHTHESAAAAIASMHGFSLNNRPLRCSWGKMQGVAGVQDFSAVMPVTYTTQTAKRSYEEDIIDMQAQAPPAAKKACLSSSPGGLALHVVGDAYVDIVAGPLVGLPTWGADVRTDHIRQTAGGSALNVAVQMAALMGGSIDGTCTLHGLVADDALGGFLRARVQAAGVQDNLQVAPAGTQTGACIVLSGVSDRAFVSHTGANAALTTAHLTAVAELAAGSQGRRTHIHVAGYYCLPGLHTHLAGLLRDLRAAWGPPESAAPLTVSLGTNFDATGQWDGGLLELLPLVDVLLVSAPEACAMARASDLTAACGQLATHVRGVAIATAGAEGAYSCFHAATPDAAVVTHHPAAAGVAAVDATGAGDAFAAGFVWKYVQGDTVAAAIQFAAACGACCVTKVGACTDPPSEAAVTALVTTFFPTPMEDLPAASEAAPSSAPETESDAPLDVAPEAAPEGVPEVASEADPEATLPDADA